MVVEKFVLGVIAATTVFAVTGEASASEAVLRSCVTPLNAGQISATRFPSGVYGIYKAPVSANPGPDTCESYSWVYSAQQSFYFTAIPGWAGPVASYCPHSSIEYALYSWYSSSWHYAGGGLMWGKDSGNGTCTYDVANASGISYGTNMTRAGVLPTGGYYIVAVKSAAHNHSGNDCGSAISCYWPTNIGFVRT